MATILLIDDEKILRTLLAVALRRQNHTVIEAGNARQGLAKTRKAARRVDLLIAASTLPAMSAARLAAELTALFPGMKILLLARGSGGVLEEQRAVAGTSSLLHEPFELRDLIGEVARLLDLPEGTRIPPARSAGTTAQSERAAANGEANS